MNKPNLLVPIAGKGQRFLNDGYTMPKPLIMVDNKHIIDWSFLSLNSSEYNITFVVRKDHVNDFGIDEILKDKFGKDINVVVTDVVTRGTVESCLLAKDIINNDSPLVIYTLDVHFQPVFSINDVDSNDDGMILTFKANSPSYSYVQVDKDNKAIKTAEKQVISENAAVGIYYFKSGLKFVQAAEEMIDRNLTTNEEFYVCPLYNLMINNGDKISIKHVDKMYLMGTPEELNFFNKSINKQFGNKPIALCSDHSGIKLKNIVKKLLTKMNYSFIDFGTYTDNSCDYYDYIKLATQSIVEGKCDFGFGFCRSGQGVNISANKQNGIKSALIYNDFAAEMSVRHSAANFFTFSEKYTTEEQMEQYIKIFSSNTFDGGRHQVRLQKIKN